MAITKSRDIGIYVDGVLVGCAKGGSLSIETATDDITCDDSGEWTEIETGQKSWSMDFNGVIKQDNPLNISEFADIQLGDNKIVLRFSTEVSGETFFEGDAFITSQTLTKNEGQNAATYDVSCTGTGALTKGAVA